MEELSLTDYLAILRRRKKHFLLAFGVVFVIGLSYALHWSNYRSTATVEIEEPQIPSNMTTPIGMNPTEMLEALADERVSRIEQKVTATASLIEIINKFNLYAGATKTTPLADIAEGMRKKVKIGMVSSTINAAAAGKESAEQLAAIAFTLSFDYSDPVTAQHVADEIITRFLDEDLRERREQARETSEFLATQIAALEASMADQEKRIATYHEAHGESRPEALMFNQQAMQSVTFSIQNLDSQITSNEGAQGAIRAQLAIVDPYSRVIANGQVLTTPAIQLKALEAQYSTLTAQYGPDHPDVMKARRQIASLKAQISGKKEDEVPQLKAQITDMKTNLETAKKTQGPDNPDVISLQHQLDSLEARLVAAGSTGPTQSLIKEDADNPAYLELVAQLRSDEEQYKSLKTQREALEKENARRKNSGRLTLTHAV